MKYETVETYFLASIGLLKGLGEVILNELREPVKPPLQPANIEIRSGDA